MTLQNQDDCNEVRIIDTQQGSIIKSFRVPRKDQKIADIAITKDNKKIICGGYTTKKLIVIDIDSGEITSVETSHKEPPMRCQVTDDGNFILSSSSRESRIWEVKNLENPANMKPIFDEDIRFVGLYAQNRQCGGVVQDGMYAKWKPQVLAEYTIDQESLKVIEEYSNQDNEIFIEGPMNKVFPLILKTMLNTPKKDQENYVDSLKNNMIMPQNLNIVHYFACDDNAECLQKAFDFGANYERDNQKRSPLEYALEVKSN